MPGQNEASECAYEKARKEIIARLGGGLIAERAAHEAIRHKAKRSRNVPLNYDDMFKFTGPVPDGLTPDTPDFLEKAAANDATREGGSHKEASHRDSFDPSVSLGSSSTQALHASIESSPGCGVESSFEDINESEFQSERATDSVSSVSDLEIDLDKEKGGLDSTSEEQSTIKSYFDGGNGQGGQIMRNAKGERSSESKSVNGEDIDRIAQELNGVPEQGGPHAGRGCPKSFLDSPGSKAYALMAPIPVSEPPLEKVGHGRKSGKPAAGGFVSNSLGKVKKSTELVDEFFSRYRVKQHIGSVPDFKFSQPRSAGPQETLKQARWSFDEAHPALAANHCLRSTKQNQMLEEERWQMALKRQNERLKKEREATKKKFQGLKDYAGRGRRAEEKPSPTEGSGRCKSAPGLRKAEQVLTGNRSSGDGSGSNHRALPKSSDEIDGIGRSLEALTDHPKQAGNLRTAASEGGKSINDDEEVETTPGTELASLPAPLKFRHPTWIDQDPLVHFKKPVDNELRVALGSFDATVYKAFSSEMDKTMEARSQAGRHSGNLDSGYESDLERDRECERKIMEAQEKKITEDERKRQLEDEMKDNWAEQNKWMDAYRHNVGEDGGYPTSQTLFDEQKEGLEETFGSGQFSEEDLQEFDFAAKVLSVNDRGLVKSCYIPIVSTELGAAGMPNCGYQSEDGFSHSALKQWRAKKHKPPSPTVPQPFEFEERAKDRPATIMEVKTQQDLEINRRELKALRGHAFKANPIPKSTSEPRFEQMMAGQEVKRKINHDESMKALAELEKPFSFYHRDKEAALKRKQIKNDPNRFQKPFKAKDVPRHVKEDRYVLLKADSEARKLLAKQRAETLLMESKMPPRMEDASKAHKKTIRPKKQNALDPKWGRRYAAPPRLGEIPDFDMLHQDWDDRIARAHAMNRKKMTIPEGFSFCVEDDGEQGEKARNRQKKIMVGIVMDDELPEQRWPFVSNRKKVYPRPPPVFGEPDLRVSDTRTNKLRTMAIKNNRKKGKYASAEERDLIELHKNQKSAEARAKLYVKLQRERAMQRNVESGVNTAQPPDTTQSMPDETPSCPQNSCIQGRTDTPHQYIQARHGQAEQDAREIVEEVLLQQGLDVYRYIEEESS